MIAVGALSGPLPKLGVIVLAVLAGAVLVTRDPRLRGLATAGALLLAPVLLLVDIWDSAQLHALHRHPAVAVLAVVIGLAAVGGFGVVTASRPGVLAVLAVLALPFRIPISVGETTANLLVPLYLVVFAAGVSEIVATLRTRRAAPDPTARLLAPRRAPLEWLLAAAVLLYALLAAPSPSFRVALQQTVFFYVPFTLLFALLRRVTWTRQLLRQCGIALAALALALACIGFVEYATKTLLLNPKLIAANDVHTYFTINSVFFDPDIFGRFLALVMLGVAVLLLTTRSRREQYLAAGTLAILWGCLVLTLSRSSLVALLLGLAAIAALCWRVGPVLLAGAVVVLVGLVVLIASPKTFGLDQGLNGVSSGRADLVSGGLALFGDRPIAGFGSGSFVTEYRAHHPGTQPQLAASHAIPITIAAEEGVVGLLVYVSLVGAILMTMFRGARGDPARVAIAVATLALVFHTLLYADFLEDPSLWALLGAGVALAATRSLPLVSPQSNG